MQVLCIETGKGNAAFNVQKGNIYNSLLIEEINKVYKGIDLWHKIEESPVDIDRYHVTIFVELPNEEGVVFSKKEELIEH